MQCNTVSLWISSANNQCLLYNDRWTNSLNISTCQLFPLSLSLSLCWIASSVPPTALPWMMMSHTLHVSVPYIVIIELLHRWVKLYSTSLPVSSSSLQASSTFLALQPSSSSTLILEPLFPTSTSLHSSSSFFPLSPPRNPTGPISS